MKDILIVGFGLAGLSIAKHAEERKLSFDIVSDQSQRSSRIAGGIINPIAIKRMKPVWKVEQFFPFADAYYKSLKLSLNYDFYSSKAIRVIIHNANQENGWYESYDNPRVQPFIYKNLLGSSEHYDNKRFGIVKAAVVNLNDLFRVSSEHYVKANIWKTESLLHSSFNLSNDYVEYKSNSYRHVIFCEGYGVHNNPFFNDLGIYGNKGDYLILRAKQLNCKDILKAKYFLIPLGNDYYKFGATYQREPLDHNPSSEARSKLTAALNKMINSPFEIVDQLCGIRPTTRDRKPILGTHRTHKNLHIINGFGSRGVLTSPLLGKNLIAHIFEEKSLDNEISINRIYART